MKKRTILLYGFPLIMLACNSKPKDSVQAADSTNVAKRDVADSAGTFAADPQTSDFLVKAANGGMAEVKLGELATQKANNAKVKSMGEMMVKDHSAGNAEVKNLATQLNVTLPSGVSEDMQKVYDDMAKKSGR